MKIVLLKIVASKIDLLRMQQSLSIRIHAFLPQNISGPSLLFFTNERCSKREKKMQDKRRSFFFHWKIAFVLMLSSFVFGFFGCERNRRESFPSSTTLRLAMETPVRSLHPHLGVDNPTTHVIRMVYEGLLRKKGKEGVIVPGVATHYTVSKDQLTYTFHLRKSFWANGDLVTAHDFERTWKEAVSPGSVCLGAAAFAVLKNGKACLQGEKDSSCLGVHAWDEQTLVVSLDHLVPYFSDLVCSTIYFPVHVSKQEGGEVIGNGPFMVQRWQVGGDFVAQKNPLYWDEKEVSLSKIDVQVIPDPAAQFYLYEQGELDYIGDPFNPLPVDLLRSSQLANAVQTKPSVAINWILINTREFPLNSVHFRKALSQVIDREALTKYVLELQERPTSRLTSLKDYSENSSREGKTMQEEGMASLQKALLERNLSLEDLPKLRLSHRSSLWATRLMQELQQQWQEKLGIQVDLEVADWSAHFQKVAKGNYQLAEMKWIPWVDDPTNLLEMFAGGDFAINVTGWCDAEYEQHLFSANWEKKRKKRIEALKKAEDRVLEQMPVIPLCFVQISYLHPPYLKGVSFSTCTEIDFKWAFIEYL